MPRQNRTLNASILLPGNSETIVPVSCTEAGRWSYKSAAFADAGYISPHKLRKTKSSSVAASLKAAIGHKSDQHAAWGEVANLCLASTAHSSTSAMQDALLAKAREVGEYLQNLKPLPNQKGLVALVNGEVACVDVVSSAKAYQSLHTKFVQSYALHALLEQKPAVEGTREKVAAFFEDSATNHRIHHVVGCGEDHRFEGPSIAGAALVAKGWVAGPERRGPRLARRKNYFWPG